MCVQWVTVEGKGGVEARERKGREGGKEVAEGERVTRNERKEEGRNYKGSAN